jgi:hypothetical protein
MIVTILAPDNASSNLPTLPMLETAVEGPPANERSMMTGSILLAARMMRLSLSKQVGRCETVFGEQDIPGGRRPLT